MSSEEKMGSRYSHVAWHLSQLSSMSCIQCAKNSENSSKTLNCEPL